MEKHKNEPIHELLPRTSPSVRSLLMGGVMLVYLLIVTVTDSDR